MATTSALNALENEITNISNFVKKNKTDYDTKTREIEKKVTNDNHDKDITTPKFNRFTAEIYAARLTQANLVTKTDLIRN